MRKTTVTIASGIAAALLLAGAAFAGDTTRENAVNESLPSIAQELRDLRRRLERIELASRLESASIGEGGIRVLDDGSVRSGDFDGDLAAGNLGTQGWALGADTIVVGTAAVRDNVGTVVEADLMATGVTVSLNSQESALLPYEEYAAVSVAVPTWASTAQVFASTTANFANGNLGNGEWTAYQRIDIEGSISPVAEELMNVIDKASIGTQWADTIDVSALTTIDVSAQGQRSSRAVSSETSTFIGSGTLVVIAIFSV